VNPVKANSTSTADLVLRAGDGSEYPLGGVCLIGRETECRITLDTPQVSRYHAKLTPHDSRSVLVEDLHSTNGTFINGQRVTTPQLLSIGDELRLDQVSFRLATASSGGAQATVFTSVDAVKAALAAAQPTPPPLTATPTPPPLTATPAPPVAPPVLRTPPPPPVAVESPRPRPQPQQPPLLQPRPLEPAIPDEAQREHTSMLDPDERARLNQIAHHGVRQQRSGGPRLVVLSAPARGHVIPLQRSNSGGNGWVIGRAIDSDVTLTDRTISAHHARLEKNDGKWRIENLNATNGLFVNGELVPATDLKNGDRIRLGGTELEFRIDQSSTAPATILPAADTPRHSGTLLWLGVGAAVFVGITVLAMVLGN
jgi:pSer/pThr/pTyr-binding forkhead associated (FHA) protein